VPAAAATTTNDDEDASCSLRPACTAEEQII
jgi:hypothetical protein